MSRSSRRKERSNWRRFWPWAGAGVVLILVLAVGIVALRPKAAGTQGTSTSGEDCYVLEENDDFQLRSGDVAMILNIDGIGPLGTHVRGVGEILQEGDPVIREVVEGHWIELGYIKQIDLTEYTVTMCIYQNPSEVTAPSWANQ